MKQNIILFHVLTVLIVSLIIFSTNGISVNETCEDALNADEDGNGKANKDDPACCNQCIRYGNGKFDGGALLPTSPSCTGPYVIDFEWENKATQKESCCGDDANEKLNHFVFYDNFGTLTEKQMHICCTSISDCVIGSGTTPSGYCCVNDKDEFNYGENYGCGTAGEGYSCWEGSLYDPDYWDGQSYCNLADGNHRAIAGESGVGEYDDTTKYECCGDDKDEFYKCSLGGAVCKCCKTDRASIDANGNCAIETACSDGADNDGDTFTDEDDLDCCSECLDIPFSHWDLTGGNCVGRLNQDFSWKDASQERNCCGDDANEEYNYYQRNDIGYCNDITDNFCVGKANDANDDACCMSTPGSPGAFLDCVYNGKCYPKGAVEDIDGEGAICVGTKWIDCDNFADKCESSCGKKWIIGGESSQFGEYNTGNAIECCGDDDNEFYKCNSATPQVCKCCKTDASTIGADGMCKSTCNPICKGKTDYPTGTCTSGSGDIYTFYGTGCENCGNPAGKPDCFYQAGAQCPIPAQSCCGQDFKYINPSDHQHCHWATYSCCAQTDTWCDLEADAEVFCDQYSKIVTDQTCRIGCKGQVCCCAQATTCPTAGACGETGGTYKKCRLDASGQPTTDCVCCDVDTDIFENWACKAVSAIGDCSATAITQCTAADMCKILDIIKEDLEAANYPNCDLYDDGEIEGSDSDLCRDNAA
ncbi:MAG: hypothetical protein ABIG95_06320, partial [Candidatus Woesearchaeota archaeon]